MNSQAKKKKKKKKTFRVNLQISFQTNFFFPFKILVQEVRIESILFMLYFVVFRKIQVF